MLLLVVIALLGVSALLAGSETALFALARMQHTRASLGETAAKAVESLLRRPLESLMVIIGFNEAVNVFAECLATTFLLTWLGPPGGWISVPVMFVLVLLVSDITPKTFALGFPAAVARVTARPLATVALTFHPLARLFVPEEAPHAAPLSESEFKALLVASERSGQVASAERELIDKVFAFGSRRVSEIMTPRERIFALDLDTAVDRIIAEVAHAHYSRVPVYRGNPNNIVGVLRAKDLVARRLESPRRAWSALSASPPSCRRARRSANCSTRCAAAAFSSPSWSTNMATCSGWSRSRTCSRNCSANCATNSSSKAPSLPK